MWLFIRQAGKLYIADDPFLTFEVGDEPGPSNVFGLLDADFREVTGSGFDEASTPDLASGILEFGFGASVTTTLNSALNVGPAWSDATVRLQVVPEPTAAAVMAAMGLGLFARRSRRLPRQA
jgi:hypothetical protein